MSDINSISNDSRDARRKKEAMEQIVNNIINNDSEEISLSIREALERGWNFKFSDRYAHYVLILFIYDMLTVYFLHIYTYSYTVSLKHIKRKKLKLSVYVHDTTASS